MPLVSEMVHPAGFDFQGQRAIALLRDVKKMKWGDIALQITNLKGKRPRARHVANTHKRLTKKTGTAKYKYQNCGLQPTKATKDVEEFLIKELKTQRQKGPCTSTDIQAALAKQKKVQLTAAYIRKLLVKHGFKWLPRRQKKKYSAEVMAERLAFASRLARMNEKSLHKAVSLFMDGVVLGMPPKDATERLNFCRAGEEFMWRKPDESFVPKLAGDCDYAKQVPLHRAVPLWGGCSHGGFAPIVFHKNKKLTAEEWVGCVNAGKLASAITSLKPARKTGAWQVVCDNEGFLQTAAATKAHKRSNLKLLRIPAKSPDLNPIERFWGWLRKKLRAMDLKDAVASRPVLDKSAYIARVRRVVKSKAAQKCAANCAKSLRKVCKEVVLKKGAASSG